MGKNSPSERQLSPKCLSMPAGNPTSQSCLDTIAPDPVGCTQVLTMPGSLRVQGAMASTLDTQSAHDTEGTTLSSATKSRGPWRVYAGTTLASAGGLHLWGQACPEPATPLADLAIPLKLTPEHLSQGPSSQELRENTARAVTGLGTWPGTE